MLGLTVMNQLVAQGLFVGGATAPSIPGPPHSQGF
jgi:hypothetical protein